MISQNWDDILRQFGYRITPQRQMVLEAINKLGHATPEELCAEVQRSAAGVNLSTIYRTIEVLEEVGLVTHTHIGHGAPTYHSVEDDPHLHLICDTCGKVESVDISEADGLVQRLRETVGFEPDISHVSVRGQCASCVERQKMF